MSEFKIENNVFEITLTNKEGAIIRADAICLSNIAMVGNSATMARPVLEIYFKQTYRGELILRSYLMDDFAQWGEAKSALLYALNRVPDIVIPNNDHDIFAIEACGESDYDLTPENVKLTPVLGWRVTPYDEFGGSHLSDPIVRHYHPRNGDYDGNIRAVVNTRTGRWWITEMRIPVNGGKQEGTVGVKEAFENCIPLDMREGYDPEEEEEAA